MFDYEFKPGYISYEAFKEMRAKLNGTIKGELKLIGDAADRAMSSYIERDLRPEDIGLTNPTWRFPATGSLTSASTLAWSNLVNTFTIADNRYVGINGVRYPSDESPQVLTQLRIDKANKTVRYWSIQGCNTLENVSMFFPDPVTIEQNVPITIQAYNATTTITPQNLIFTGIVVEKEGILTSK